MQLMDIAKAVIDITGKAMDELLELAGKLSMCKVCILNRLALVMFQSWAPDLLILLL